MPVLYRDLGGMMIRLACVATLVLGWPASSRAVPKDSYSVGQGPHDLCGFQTEDAAKFRALAERSPDYRLRKQRNGLTTFTDDKRYRLLTVTDPGHPAYPAAACRNLMRLNGEVTMKMELNCEASRRACDMLAQELSDETSILMKSVKTK